MATKATITIEWEREGAGWVGRWRTDRDTFGDLGQLVVAPTGGLWGGWRWRIDGFAEGLHDHANAREAKREAEGVAKVVL